MDHRRAVAITVPVSGRDKPTAVAREEPEAKIEELRRMIEASSHAVGALWWCSQGGVISRHLAACGWDVEKAAKMLLETARWRSEYKPEMIRWEDVASEGTAGMMFVANYLDKQGRVVIVQRPGFKATPTAERMIRYFTYCVEHTVGGTEHDNRQMVWLLDFRWWKLGGVSLKLARDTMHIIQRYYPHTLALVIAYNPPKFFYAFWKIAKNLLDPSTAEKVKFVYADEAEGRKLMEDMFDMDQLEACYGGRDTIGFNPVIYEVRMRELEKGGAGTACGSCNGGESPKFAPPELGEVVPKAVDEEQ